MQFSQESWRPEYLKLVGIYFQVQHKEPLECHVFLKAISGFQQVQFRRNSAIEMQQHVPEFLCIYFAFLHIVWNWNC